MRCTRAGYLWIMTRRSPIHALLLLALPAMAAAQSTLDAIVETKRFHVPGQGEQVDINIAVLGASAQWKPNERGLLQAQVEALTIIEKDSTIIDYRKSLVLGPERSDSIRKDFIVQEHFVLPVGEYSMSVELHDVNGTAENRSMWKGPLPVAAQPKGAHFSDVLLTAGTSTDAQGNKVPSPYTGTYFPEEQKELGFYTELYGTDEHFGKDSLFVLNYAIETYESHQVKGQFKHTQRMKAAPVVPVSVQFGIGDLPSGNYLVAIEAVDRSGQVVARQEQFIQRNNPLKYDLNALATLDLGSTFVDAITDPDTLAENVACLRPIADDLERRMIDDRWKDRDPTLMKRFFYTFWMNRDGFNPEGAWQKYHTQVKAANRLYGCRNLRGYESDQGITFLKYGLPSTVVDGSNDNKQLPYLIWHYYKAGRYSDRRFVFWQQNVGIGCWELLHSEMPGEVKNPRWQSMLSAPLGPASMSDGTRVYSIEGQRVEDNFNNPH
jgi:GWxTD domain-containing protein